METNPLIRIQDFGQSIWLDFIRRGTIISGELKQLITRDGVRGVTSNPAIFEKAINGSSDYTAAVRSLALAGKSVVDIYETLVVEDIRHAADQFRPLYDQLDGRDGFVSLEVSPLLARDTEGTIAEARRLWRLLDRPNVFIKVPATQEGILAIRQLISEGINVNVTLLFGLERYREVAEAYISGLEGAASSGRPLASIASVASFFLSRIDVLVDGVLEKTIASGGREAEVAKGLIGETAIASAKIAYQMYKEIFSSDRWGRLVDKGALPQRLLWASTSTKNPVYSDVKYIEPLIGPDTVNTLPLEALNAYRDHGNPAHRLQQDLQRAREVLRIMVEVGVDLREIAQQLEDEGIEKFSTPFKSLMSGLEEKRQEALSRPIAEQRLQLGEYDEMVGNRMSRLEIEAFAARMWRKDATLWKDDLAAGKLISNSLGWLHVAEKVVGGVPQLEAFVRELKDAGFTHVVHMGMGGSSLAPLVMQRSFARTNGLSLTVLDTTDPATILRIEREIPLENALFIIASKSGTTAEPLAFGDYFYDKLKALKGARAGENFLAITDPGTQLEELAHGRKFRRIFVNFKDIGGRYSALSYFGMVPAALAGVPIAELLERALSMAHVSASCIAAGENPSLALGAAIGELALTGRDKLTFVTSEALEGFDMWLEQLIAESTGKESTGILPVAGEEIGGPFSYGDDRVFAYVKLENEVDEYRDAKVSSLVGAGHPVITIRLKDVADIGQEFFRWEFATAVAGAVLGINPFDQPNVQESKDNTNRLLEQVRRDGKLPVEAPSARHGSLRVFADQHGQSAEQLISSLFRNGRPGDYLAIQAYLTETQQIHSTLQDIRFVLRDRLRLATTLGYGPRFLHSTGQYHKGGPNTGIFLQITADESEDAPIPGRPYTFGVLKQAQALGDLQALRKHKRRVMRIHLSDGVTRGLSELKEIVETEWV